MQRMDLLGFTLKLQEALYARQPLCERLLHFYLETEEVHSCDVLQIQTRQRSEWTSWFDEKGQVVLRARLALLASLSLCASLALCARLTLCARLALGARQLTYYIEN